MSQWGSKYLGDQGYTPINILRNYYGQSVYIGVADKVTGIPSSFPGEALRVGSSGNAVRTIQEQLNAIANNYPALPRVRVDGAYGEATANSVREFQRIFNMPVSGVVDYATWYRISDLFTAVTKLAER